MVERSYFNSYIIQPFAVSLLCTKQKEITRAHHQHHTVLIHLKQAWKCTHESRRCVTERAKCSCRCWRLPANAGFPPLQSSSAPSRWITLLVFSIKEKCGCNVSNHDNVMVPAVASCRLRNSRWACPICWQEHAVCMSTTQWKMAEESRYTCTIRSSVAMLAQRARPCHTLFFSSSAFSCIHIFLAQQLGSCEREGIVGGDEGPVGGVAQVVSHGVKVVGVHGEEGQEKNEEVR